MDVTAESGISTTGDTYSASFGDYDRDGDLDLLSTHWMGTSPNPTENNHLWANDGTGFFTPVLDQGLGLEVYHDPEHPGAKGRPGDFTLTGNFADINNEGWPDLLMTGDFGTSQVFISDGDGTFTLTTDPAVITDENGMGTSIEDYDHDGDLDWFVSSIWDPDEETPWGSSGNRLYRNRGDGSFEDATDEAGVRIGFWGWASCFADLDNDRHLDLFHVNGFVPLAGNRDDRLPIGAVFWDDPSRLFMSNGDGTFQERSVELGLDDRAQGRGVVCFDYDRDGDVDIFMANNSQPHALFRNDGGNLKNFLSVRLEGGDGNTEAVGARLFLTAEGMTQMRETRGGSNYVSQQPGEVHFGLGDVEIIDELKVIWPGGQVVIYLNLPANQPLTLTQPAPLSGSPPLRQGWQNRGR